MLKQEIATEDTEFTERKKEINRDNRMHRGKNKLFNIPAYPVIPVNFFSVFSVNSVAKSFLFLFVFVRGKIVL